MGASSVEPEKVYRFLHLNFNKSIAKISKQFHVREHKHRFTKSLVIDSNKGKSEIERETDARGGGLEHEMKKIGGGLYRLRDLISHNFG